MYTSEQLKRYLRGEQTVSYSDNPAPTVSEGAKAGTSDELKQYLASIHYPASEPAAAGGSFFRRAADTVKSIATPENAAYTQQMKAYDTALAGIERQMADLRDSALQEGTARYLVGEGNFTSDGSLDRYQELGAQKQAILRERENLNLAIRAVEFAKLSDSDAAKLEEILSFENWWTEDQSGYIAAQGGMSPWAQPTAEYRERESRVNQYREELKQKYNYDFLHDYYTRVRNEKKAVQEQQKWQEYVNQGPVEAALANLISVPMGLAGGAMGALETARQKVGKAFSGQTALPIDANSQYYGLTKAANAIREQTAQNIDNDIVGFLYQTGMSGLDSLAASLVPGGAVLLATNAGTSGFLDAKARGASDDEAVAMGIASGVFEGLFESVSLGKLADTVKKAPKTFRGLVKDGLVSMGVNASEETFTEIADVLADSFIMGDLSEYNLAVKSYREAGLSEEEAKNRAARDTFGQIVTAGLGGAVMGGAFTGVGSLTGNINSRRLTQAARDYESLANANASLLGTTAETNAQQVKQVSDFLTATTADNGQTAEYTEQAVNARDNIGQWLNNLSAISESNLDQQVQSNVQALRPQLTALYNYAAEKAAAVGSSEANNYAIRRIAREVLSDIRKENLPESHAENVEGFLDSVQGTGMNPDTVTQLAQLARQISLPIRADESLGDGIRAAYDADTKTIYINPNAVTTALSAAHELAHATELLEEYPEMKDYILRHAQQLYGKSLSELVAEKQEQYSARAGQALTREEAELEIVAGVFDSVLTDERFLRRLYTADRGLFYRLYRFVHYQLERMSNSIRNGLANPEERSRQNVLLRSQYMMENLVRRLDGETALRRLRTTAEAQAAQIQSEQRRSGSTFLPDGERNETQAAGEANSSQQAAEPEPYFEGGINHPDVLVANIENRIRQNNEQQQPMSTEEFYRFLDEQNARIAEERNSRRRNRKDRRKFSVAEDAEGRQIVVVEDNIFAGKRDKPRYKVVRDYLREHIGEIHTIASDGRAVYLGKDLPGEYTLSEYSKRLLRKDKSKAYAKNQAAQYLGELIEIAENPSWQENRKAKHAMDAKYGWWKYDTRFAVPVRDNSVKITNYRTYDASLLIRHDADGKYYLYDILGINENRTSARGSQGAIASQKGGSQDSASDNTIAQRTTGVNHQSMQNQAEHASETEEFYRLLDEQNARLDADRNSRRRRQYSLNEKFKDEYDAWDKKTEGKPFYIGNTSDALESVGVRDYGFYWDKSKIVKIKEKHPDMTDDVIKRVPEILENPVLIMESLTVPGRITLYGEVTDAKGIPVLVAVELSPTNRNGEILDMAKIASTYGKERTQNLIDRSTILYIDPNKNRTDNWSRAHRLQLPTGLTSYGPINTIAQRATGVNNQSMQNQAEHAQPRRKFSVAEDAEGRQIVVVEDNIFAGKEDVSKNKVVRDYIRQHIGEVKTISSDGRAVYIGKELPGEYTLSQYSKNLRSNRTLSNAKNQAAQNLGELIEIAENPSWQENRKAKHAMDAKYGWWRYNTRFAIPGKSKYHIFDANLLIRHAADGKYYLYDVLGIKENRTSAEGYQVAIASQKGGSQGSASDNTIAQRATGVNNQSMQNRAEHASGTEAFYRLLDEQNAKLDADRSSRRKEKSKLRYSIDYTTDNRPVVIVDKNILDGVPRSRWVETVKNTLSDNFSDGIPVAGRLIKVNRTSRDEFTNSRDSQRYRKYNRDIYRDKFTSAGNLDEILLASTNYVNEDLNHRRKDNFKEFARGDVLLRIGNRDYSAKVIVGFTTGNQMVLYDVIDFTPTEIQLKKEGTHTAQPQSAKSSRQGVPSRKGTHTAQPQSAKSSRNSVPSADGNTPPAFDPIIAQRAAGVNNQSMQNQAEHASETEEFYRLLDEQNARLDADRSSRRRRQYSLNEKFKDEYDAWDKKTEGKPFYIGNTSDALESVGVRDYGFYWDKSKIVKIKEKHPDMTDDVIKRVPEILENPVLIMESLTVPGRITLYGEVTDAKGIPVLVAVELNPSGKSGRILNMAKIASAYGRKGENATQSLIDRSTILYIDPNKNRTDNWSRALRLQLPTGLTSYGPINTIAQRAAGVNNQSMQNRAEHAQPRRKFSVASQEDIENLRDGRYTEDRGEENGRQAEVRLSAARGGLRSVGSGSTGRLGDENLYAGRGSGNNGDGQRNREVAEGAGNSLLKERFHGKEYTYKVVKKENASPRARQIAEEFEKLGITPIIVDGSVKELRNGKEFIRNTFARSDGKVFISNQISDQLASMAVPHESIHQMMFLHPELYQSVKNALIESGITMQLSDGSPHPILKSLLETYRNNNPEFSNLNGVEKMYNELLAQISGYHAADPELARKMFGTLVNDYDNVLKHILSSLDRLKKAQAENSPQRENAGGSSVSETHVKYSKKENRASALAASNATIRPSEEGGQNPVDTSTLAQRATGVNNQSMQNQTEHAQPRRKLSAAEDTKNIENLRDGRYTEDKVEENGGQAERTPETAIEESWNYNEQTDRRRDKDNTGVRESGLRNHVGYLNRGPQEFSSANPGGKTTSNQVRGRDGTAADRGTQKYGEVTLQYQPTNEAAVESNARQARDGFAEYGIQAEIVDRIETDRGGGADDFNRSGIVSAATTPDGKILIYNTEGSSPENVVNHELVHYMRRNAPDLYQAMENAISLNGVDGGILASDEGSFAIRFIKNYERLHPGISLDTPHFYEELLSYVSGLHAQDPEFARQVFGTFIRDYDAVVDAITSSLDKFKKAQAENSPQRENAGGSSVPETHVKYSVAEDGRLSRFFTSVLDSKNIPEDYKARIREDAKAFYYEVEHNEDTLKRAVDRVLEDPDRALARFLGKSPRQADRTDIAVGMVLQSNLLAQKDYAGAVDVTEKLQKIGTQAGQSVQAFTFLNRMTPDGMVYYASSTLDKVYNELSKNMGRKAREKLKEELNLTPLEAEYIYSLMRTAQQMGPGRERDIVIASINEMVQSKIPTHLRDKLKSWLRISMLLNPKTMIRNVMSNVLMYPAHMVSDVVGSAIDRAVQRIGRTGVRTTGVMSLSSQLSGARKGAFESFDDFRRHINTRGAAGRYEIRREGTPFNRQGGPLSRALAKVDSVTGFLLDAGDRPFFEAYFINSLNNQLRLNNVTEPTAEMTDIATTEALQRTWQDDNKYTKAFGSIRRALNFGGDFGLGTIAVPFTKTPANLVKALVDFSPAGLIRGLTRDIVRLNRAKSNGEGLATAQRTLVRDVANGFVGTLLMMTGYVLAANGVVTGSGEDDRDAAAYSRDMMGISPYSFILGDGTSVTYDWAAPIGTLIGIGADIKKELDASRDSGDDFVGKLLGALGVAGTAAVVGANTLFEQSLFTGIRDLFGGTYGTIPEGILGTALNLPSQFVPTFLSQIAQALDPYQRVQYVKGNEFQSTLNEVLAKIPGLRGTLEIKRNNLGGYVNKNGGFTTVGAGASTILNTFLNPSNVNTKQPTELQKRLWALYEKTGNEAIFPSTAPDSFRNDGKTYVLSPQQKNRYLKAAGTYYTENAQRILDSHQSNEEKAAELADLVTKSRAYAKEEIIKIIEGEA